MSSTKDENQNTTATLQDAAEMIQSGLSYYQKAGGRIRAGNAKDGTLILAFPRLRMCSKCNDLIIMPAGLQTENPSPPGPELCQKCSGGKRA
jgi:hypothetical protein